MKQLVEFRINDGDREYAEFGIYDKKTKLSNLYVQGNFDLQNIKATIYEISDNNK